MTDIDQYRGKLKHLSPVGAWCHDSDEEWVILLSDPVSDEPDDAGYAAIVPIGNAWAVRIVIGEEGHGLCGTSSPRTLSDAKRLLDMLFAVNTPDLPF